MIAPDLYLKDRLGAWLTTLRSQPTMVDDVFRGMSADTRAKIKSYLLTAKIDLRLGWVMDTTPLPVIAVTLPSEQEQTQFIGSEPGEVYNEDSGLWLPNEDVATGYLIDSAVAEFSGAVDVAVYAQNATEATWLAAIMKWLLLQLRTELDEQGLRDQRLTMTDFMPASEYPAPDPAYTRVVKLTYTTFVDHRLFQAQPGGATPVVVSGTQVIHEDWNDH